MNYINLPISRGLVTKIDADTYEKLKSDGFLKWCAQKAGKKYYASRTHKLGRVPCVGKIKYKTTKMYLHRYIMDFPENIMIDHINGDSLDNRKINLRICSARINAKNRNFDLIKKNTYLGVCKSRKSFAAQLSVAGTHFNIGYFASEIDAARARDIVDVIVNGKDAKPNFEVSWKFLKVRDLIIY